MTEDQLELEVLSWLQDVGYPEPSPPCATPCYRA